MVKLVICIECGKGYEMKMFYKNDLMQGRKRQVCRLCHEALRLKRIKEREEITRPQRLERARAYRKIYWRENKEKIKEKRRERADEIKAYQKAYRESHKEKMRAYQADYRKRKRDERMFMGKNN